jgi:dipeptidyl aminopeptidase/acylaminoacyl peptidase
VVPLIPLAHFFDNPERAAARVSPDGRRLAYLAPVDGVLNVWVRRIGVAGGDGQGDDRPVTHDRDRGVRAYFWSRDAARILYLQDRAGEENHHVYAASLDRPDRPARDLTPFDGVKAGVIAVPRETPGEILVSMNLTDRSVFDVFRLRLATGKLTRIADNPGNVIGWLADRTGALRAAYAQTPTGDYELLVRDRESEPFRVLAGFANEDGGGPYAFSPDGREIWVASARGSDTSRLVAIDCATGAERVIDGDDEVDVGGVFTRDRTGELLGTFYVRDRLEFRAAEPETARLWERFRELHPGDPSGLSRDEDERLWVVAFDDDREPGATYLYDRTTDRAEFLFRPRPWLDPKTLAPMTPVVIDARDGLRLRSYLTLPVGVEPRDLPMVLLVHGGPWARDAWGFRPEVQFLANRGYAVLQVNYRGSTGFGKRLMHAAEREFAGKMHDDLIDAVEWAVGEGIADRARVAIFGGSYGGYAALVGATFTPDVFAAVVSYVGPSSLVTLVRSFPAYWRPFMESTWFRFVGDPEKPDDVADMEARSPLNRVDAIRAPLLVIQGATDPRVTRQESEQIVAALRARGVAVEYLVKEDEGHGFVKPENRMEAYRAIELFLARHLGGRAEE